jgi:hypothetical protein
MNEFLSENRLSLTQAAKQLGVNTSTCWRWAQKGVRNVRLSTFSIGAKRFATPSAIEEFIESTTRAAEGETAPTCPSRTSRRSQRELDDAVKYLESEKC